MKLSELKTFNMVEFRNGLIGLVILDVSVGNLNKLSNGYRNIIYVPDVNSKFLHLSQYTEDMLMKIIERDFDIVAVYELDDLYSFYKESYIDGKASLLWEREYKNQMTLEDAQNILDCEILIKKEE